MIDDALAHLLELGFEEADEFVLIPSPAGPVVNTRGRVAGTRTRASAPSVYAWVACRPSGADVIYIGMASAGWVIRRNQHFHGFRDEMKAGGKNRLGVLAELEAGVQVKVLEKPAGAAGYFGVMAPTHGAEEWALLAMFEPKLNRRSDIDRAKRFAADAPRVAR
jgi:hypothetical protein